MEAGNCTVSSGELQPPSPADSQRDLNRLSTTAEKVEIACKIFHQSHGWGEENLWLYHCKHKCQKGKPDRKAVGLG